MSLMMFHNNNFMNNFIMNDIIKRNKERKTKENFRKFVDSINKDDETQIQDTIVNTKKYLNENMVNRVAVIKFLNSLFFMELNDVDDNIKILEMLMDYGDDYKTDLDNVIKKLSNKSSVIDGIRTCFNLSNLSPESEFDLLNYIPIDIFENEVVRTIFVKYLSYTFYDTFSNNCREFSSLRYTPWYNNSSENGVDKNFINSQMKYMIENPNNQTILDGINLSYQNTDSENESSIKICANKLLPELSRLISIYTDESIDFMAEFEKDIQKYTDSYDAEIFHPFYLEDGIIKKDPKFVFCKQIDREEVFTYLYSIKENEFIDMGDIRLCIHGISHNPYAIAASRKLIYTTGTYIYYVKKAAEIIEKHLFK